MKFKLTDIRPNPFRDLDRYPIQREKIDALRASIRETGFWDNVVARTAPDGTAEIAYGHHRLTALREEYPDGDFEVDLIVRDLSDETMLKIMAAENMDEWKTDFAVIMETVRAVVLAYGAGKIAIHPPLGKVRKDQMRYAPGFTLGDDDGGRAADRPYTGRTIACWLGWIPHGAPSGVRSYKVEDALQALRFIEDGLVESGMFNGLSVTAARKSVEAVARVVHAREQAAEEARQRAAAARKPAKAAQAAAGRAADEAEALAGDGALQAAASLLRIPDTERNYNDLADTTARMLLAYLDIPTGVGPRLDDIIANRDRLHPTPRADLGEAIKIVAARLALFADRLLDGFDPDA